MSGMERLLFIFCCSMRGRHDYVSEAELAELVCWLKDRLEKPFELVTDHQTKAGAIAKDDSEPNVYSRENNRMNRCDFVVCEISDPSGGVGGQAVYAEQNGIPLLLLAHSRVPETEISKYLRDMAVFSSQLVTLEWYSGSMSALDIVRQFGWQVYHAR